MSRPSFLLRSVLLAALAPLAATSAIGCFADPDEPYFGSATPGDRGNAWFSYGASYGCTFLDSCGLDRAMVTGVDETISVTIDDPESNDPTGTLRFSSDDEDVVRVTSVLLTSSAEDTARRTYAVGVLATGAGSAALSVRRPAGALLDVAHLRVRDAARLEVVSEPADALRDGVVTAPMHTQISMIGVVYDVRGEALLANEEVVWTITDEWTAHISQFLVSGPTIAEDRVYLEGMRPGATTLTARIGGLERTVRVVVPEGR